MHSYNKRLKVKWERASPSPTPSWFLREGESVSFRNEAPDRLPMFWWEDLHHVQATLRALD